MSRVWGRLPSGCRGAFAGLVAGLAAAGLLTGCGFHMEGASPLPSGVSRMHVSYYNAYQVDRPPLVKALKQRLRRQHRLGGPDAPATLDILSVSTRGNLAAVSPVDASAAVEALTTRVVFDYTVNGKKFLSHATLSDSQTYTVSPGQRLAGETERQRLTAELQRDLANRIFERIERANRQHGSKPSNGG